MVSNKLSSSRQTVVSSMRWAYGRHAGHRRCAPQPPSLALPPGAARPACGPAPQLTTTRGHLESSAEAHTKTIKQLETARFLLQGLDTAHERAAEQPGRAPSMPVTPASRRPAHFELSPHGARYARSRGSVKGKTGNVI